MITQISVFHFFVTKLDAIALVGRAELQTFLDQLLKELGSQNNAVLLVNKHPFNLSLLHRQEHIGSDTVCIADL